MAEENRKKQNIAHDDPSTIFFKIVGQKGEERHYRLKRTTKLGKVFDAFCDQQRLVRDSIDFLYHGNRLRPSLAPIDLDMEDGDQIEAMNRVGGGGGGGGSGRH